MHVGFEVGSLGLFAPPGAPGMGTHSPFPLPWEARGNVCRWLSLDQPLHSTGGDAEVQGQQMSWPGVWVLCRILRGI